MKPIILVPFAAMAALAGASATASRLPNPDPKPVSASMLKQDMRKLWTDHVVWTRDYIIAAVADAPDQKAAADRLMKNQEDIGNAVAGYYGKPAGDSLTHLLKDHINISTEIVKAAKAGNTTDQNAADKRWHQNGDNIAAFLNHANPTYWPKATLSEMMNKHLSTTTDELKARLNKDWDGDVKAFDAVYDHILKMSDALSSGIAKQFPKKVMADQ
jgi:hypothetical protein